MASSVSSAPLEISRLHWPVTVLGHGQRVGIWFQGCKIRCPGCCSRDTWASDATRRTTVGEVLDWVAGLPMAQIAGFTISGGEPFDQPEALSELLQALRTDYGTGRDILVYSGHPWRCLEAAHAAILAEIDVVISEPYLAHRPTDGLRGSDNQRMHCLTPLAEERYASGVPVTGNMQVHFDGQTLWMIGIPRPGALEQLQESLATRGITLGQPSWRA